jgi:hypothetical protein
VLRGTDLTEASSAASVTELVWDLTGSEDARILDHLLIMNKYKRTTIRVHYIFYKFLTLHTSGT